MSNDRTIDFVKKTLLDDKFPDRVVTVWGAGASAACGVPTGSFLLAKMKQDLDKLRTLTSLAPTERTSKRGGRKDAGSVPENNGNPLTVEHMFSEYANWHKERGEEELYKWLRKYIPTKNDNHPKNDNYQYVHSSPCFPSVAHELCAHLAGSHKLRYFISLNFDEILESTLEEEIGADNIHVASSDDEFARLADTHIKEWESEFGFSASGSFVLKPHGTVSRRLTLKHLPSKVECFSEAKAAALTHVMKKRVIILLGFGNYNRDFQKVFLDAFNRGDFNTIVLVDKEPEKIKGLLPAGTVYPFKGSIDAFFKELVTQLEKDQHYRYSTQSSIRHRIRCHYFSLFSRELHAGGNEGKFISQGQVLAGIPRWWLMVRLYELELLTYLLKTRGLFIQMAVLECGRLEAALRKALAYLKDTSKRVEFMDLSPEVRLRAILGDDLFGYSYVHDRQALCSLSAFWCFLLVQKPTPRCSHNMDMKRELGGICRKIAKRFSAWLIKESKHIPKDAQVWIRKRIRGDQNFEIELGGLLAKLHGDFDIDLSDEDLTGILRFKKARHISERSQLSNYTNSLLERKWTRLRIGTVAGEWLAAKLAAVQRNHSPTEEKIIEVISNLDVFTKKGSKYQPYQLFHYRNVIETLKRLIRELDRLKHEISEFTLYGVQNWEHHMLLAEDNGILLQGGIYFKRYGKGTTISPVRLTSPDDLRRLQTYFDDRVRRIKGRNSSTEIRLLHIRSHKTGLTIVVTNGLGETDELCLYESLKALQSDTINISVESATEPDIQQENKQKPHRIRYRKLTRQ